MITYRFDNSYNGIVFEVIDPEFNNIDPKFFDPNFNKFPESEFVIPQKPKPTAKTIAKPIMPGGLPSKKKQNPVVPRTKQRRPLTVIIPRRTQVATPKKAVPQKAPEQRRPLTVIIPRRTQVATPKKAVPQKAPEQVKQLVEIKTLSVGYAFSNDFYDKQFNALPPAPIPPKPIPAPPSSCPGLTCFNGTTYTCVDWKYIQGAYVAAITVCDMGL